LHDGGQVSILSRGLLDPGKRPFLLLNLTTPFSFLFVPERAPALFSSFSEVDAIFSKALMGKAALSTRLSAPRTFQCFQPSANPSPLPPRGASFLLHCRRSATRPSLFSLSGHSPSRPFFHVAPRLIFTSLRLV